MDVEMAKNQKVTMKKMEKLADKDPKMKEKLEKAKEWHSKFKSI